MFQNKSKTVSEYLEALPDDRRAVVSQLPLDVVGDVIGSTPVDAYVQMYLESRKKTSRQSSGQASKGR